MTSGSELRECDPTAAHAAPDVRYVKHDQPLTQGVLASLGFGATALSSADPRRFNVALEPLGTAVAEEWHVTGPVISGTDGALQWSRGGGWLFAAIELDEGRHGGAEETARLAYAALSEFVAASPERHVQRIWNYLGAINQGQGDDERYKHFCQGRMEGMGDIFAHGFPAATAIGHHATAHRLQVYLLASSQPGTRIENPRQVSAWQYPRQYGRTPPSFARATLLPAGDVLAISGTASVVGHASAHAGNLDAQLDETLVNLETLLTASALPRSFDARAPLKVYVRHREHEARVRAFLAQRLPDAPALLLHGDICRDDLLVEIDGWRYRT
ncbi:chorismate lyase/3-hydroxybenzoate synthase [Luteibacter sp. Sphag1AF]|uniref:chorismate transformation enzyme, FkbO/Hyg5 family n=1 Tax=Luteibacter sp. Sphag1AF TaxID=2587031 RepID=UPI00183EE730|nr:pteridine-dependent deoxygenase [Luteibacter sp. Sphag1AF]MBB3226376.1 chorismate lyase/3-hydroxybenzoate synthase [Luteibacter sp. Sphag1AF]